MAEKNAQELAESRTAWADERTRMAEERTFAAWIRTGLSLVGAGLAAAKLMASVEPQWLVRTLGCIFVFLGGSIFVLGFMTYREVAQNLKEEEIKTTSVGFIGALTSLLIVASILVMVLIFL